ncbi:MAG: hypothetical protein WD049_07610 [Candidatus Paceibacterota bacterium]
MSMSQADISKHLIADWVPSLAMAVGPSFMAWPHYLIGNVDVNGTDYLAIHEDAGRSDRQWKSVLSWMLGVVGTRQVLEDEGYRWIAPASAFYPDVRHPVDLSNWHVAYPPTSLVVKGSPTSTSQLRPDYIAIRPWHGAVDWAVVEAKGTRKPLASQTVCPSDWYKQVRNIEVRFNDAIVNVTRYLVVATRVNPNAVQMPTRRLCLRAWNSTDSQTDAPLQPSSAAEIARAHLFGFLRNIGKRELARKLTFNAQIRDEETDDEAIQGQLDTSAPAELKAMVEEEGQLLQELESDLFLRTELGDVVITIESATIRFIKGLIRAVTPIELTDALLTADAERDHWTEEQANTETPENVVTLPFGVRLTFPPSFQRSSTT